MSIYKVGFSDDTWNFQQAYEAMNDGDTIEFEEGMVFPLDESFVIKKSITLLGHCTKNEDGTRNFSNTLDGCIVIENCQVTIVDLWFEPSKNTSAIWARKKAVVTIKNCHFNFVFESDKYGVLIDDESSGTIQSISINHEDKSAFTLGVKGNSHLQMSDCYLPKIAVIHSEATIQDTNIYGKKNSNTVFIDTSKVQFEDVAMEATSDQEYPCVWAKESELIMKNSSIEQPGFVGSLTLNSRSSLQSFATTVESISMSKSSSLLENSTIQSLLSVTDLSYVTIQGSLHCLGQNNTKVDIFLSLNSTLVGKAIELHRSFNPNIRIQTNSYLYVDELIFPEGEKDQLIFAVDETSYLRELAVINESPEIVVENEMEEVAKVSALDQLNQLIGLTKVKKEIDKMLKVVQLNQQRVAKGLMPINQSLHAVFMGNPGTGKTTVARLMGQVLFENGALSGDTFNYVEVSEADLVSNHVGETVLKTTERLEEAKGGILFIDEAYTLNKKDSSVNFGQEAIDTILKYMEDHRQEIVVIFAGYTKEMEEFLRTNPGLSSRVPNTFIFEDYTPEDIVTIGKRQLEEGQYDLEDEAYYERNVARLYQASLDHSNARWIRNFNEQLIKTFAFRIIEEGSEDVSTIKSVDISSLVNKDKFENGEKPDALAELNQMIGIQSVKDQVARFVALAEVNKRREEQGTGNRRFTLHSLFLGNPGTGKTTVARLLGKAFYQKDIIKTDKFIEVSRSDLVAGYSGQTAIKTREVLMSGLGGLVFIDEAYSLYKSENDTFGLEAIDEILKFMEDYREEIVIILAGYNDEMNRFLKANSGLSSRIPNHFQFEDYTPEEITQIGMMRLLKDQYVFDTETYKQVVVSTYQRSNDFSNGRWVRNFNERLIGIASSRIANEGTNDLFTITVDDIYATGKEY